MISQNEELVQTLEFSPELSIELPKKVLFVCSGNTCRSPMAEAYMNSLSNSLSDIRAFSAGIFAAEGMPISADAVTALEDANILPTPKNRYDLHTSTRVNEKLVSQCDKIIGMTSEHTFMLMSLFPQYASKITSFKDDIPDPFGEGIEAYKLCLEKIISGIHDMFPFLSL